MLPGGRETVQAGSLHTTSEDQANTQLALLEENLRLVHRGKLVIPDGADAPTFLLSDGKINQPIQLPENLTLGQLIEQYEESLPKGAIEETTRYTIKIHSGHLREVLGESLSVRCLTRDDLQRYINTRAKKKGRHGKTLSPITIRKELTTLSGIWTWAMADGRVGPFPNKGLKFPKVAEKPPFQTWQEIEKQIERGGLSEQEQAELWDCFFLSLKETAELLKYVKQSALQPFIYPMFVFAAHTGARRSELVRSRLADFDDETVVIRERKRTKGKLTTRRVSLSPLLKKAMKDWLKEHPGGPYTFCMYEAERSKKTRPEPRPITRDEAHDHFRRTLNGSKWNKLRGWHVLRHSFISNCARKGIDQRIIDSFVGHTTDEMRRRYTRLFPSAKKEAIRGPLIDHAVLHAVGAQVSDHRSGERAWFVEYKNGYPTQERKPKQFHHQPEALARSAASDDCGARLNQRGMRQSNAHVTPMLAH